MRKEINIDFIKWMCDKAEGFEMCEDEQITTPNSDWWPISHVVDCPEKYPLLIQRAIEGVNHSQSRYKIIQYGGRINVSGKFGKSNRVTFMLASGVDLSKESALRYIFDQES